MKKKRNKKVERATVENGEFVQAIKVGDTVVYPLMAVEDSRHLLELAVKTTMKCTKVKSITWDGSDGFADIGAGMNIEFDDGKVIWGDSENGFHGFYKVDAYEETNAGTKRDMLNLVANLEELDPEEREADAFALEAGLKTLTAMLLKIK